MANLQRQIRKLNTLFLLELGSKPLYEWLHTSDYRLLHPAIVVDPITNQTILDYVCQCGKGVSVHQPTCTFTWVEPKVVIRSLVEDIKNSFVICNLQKPSRYEWRAAFGSSITYPEEGKWIPVDWNTVDPVTGATRSAGRLTSNHPTESLTWEFIRMVKESRSFTSALLQYQSEERAALKEKQSDARLRDEIREDLGVSVFPGKKEETSFPTPLNQRSS